MPLNQALAKRKEKLAERGAEVPIASSFKPGAPTKSTPDTVAETTTVENDAMEED
jgi:hypothetical protein